MIYDGIEFRPATSIGYLSRRVSQLCQAGLEPVFSAEGLTGTQWFTMIAIFASDGPTTVAAVAREVGHDTGAMTRVVDQLVREGWVARDRDANDRRLVNLTLTDAGRTVALRCKQRVRAQWNVWLADFEPAEVERMIAGMTRLKTILENAVAEQSA